MPMNKPQRLLKYILLLSLALSACTTRASGSQLSAGGSGTPAAPSVAQRSWNTCLDAVQSQKGEASSEATAFNPSSVTNLGDGEIIVVLYYPKSGTFYRCGLQKDSGGTWNVSSLDAMAPSGLQIWNAKR
jgi:hypothetical protein